MGVRVVSVAWWALAACHVTSSDVISRQGAVQRIVHPARGIAGPPALVLAGGQLRIVEPLACPTEERVVEERATRRERGPNLATFVVGVIATAIGGVLLVNGLTAEDTANPRTYAGTGLLAGGLPFAVGPWIGNGTELAPLPAGAPVTRAGPPERCGEQPLATATSATLAVRGIEVFGKVEPGGVFAVSPFAFVDAFEPGTAALGVAARIEAISGARTAEATFESQAVATAAAAFLRGADFDAAAQPLRLVPNLAPGTLRASLTATRDGPAVRIVLPIRNDGPGPTYQLRGHVTAPGTPALDGRILYFGQIAKGDTLTRELVVPVAPRAAEALRNATIELALELRDAYGTAPQTPVRFRGALLVDAPR